MKAILAACHETREVMTGVGLEVRHRGLEYTATSVPGLGAGLMIDVEFALAAPLDGPDAPLEWERRSYCGFGSAASQQVLWDYALRSWLCDELMLPTEADAQPPDRDDREALPPPGHDPPTRTQG